MGGLRQIRACCAVSASSSVFSGISRSSHLAGSASIRVLRHQQFQHGADPCMLRFRRRAVYSDIGNLSTRQVISSSSFGIDQGTSDVSGFSTERAHLIEQVRHRAGFSGIISSEQILACCGFGVEQGTSDVSSFGTEQILACCGFGVEQCIRTATVSAQGRSSH